MWPVLRVLSCLSVCLPGCACSSHPITRSEPAQVLICGQFPLTRLPLWLWLLPQQRNEAVNHRLILGNECVTDLWVHCPPSPTLYSLLFPLVLWLPLPSSVCLSISVSSPILAMMSRQKAIKYRFISLAARCLLQRGRRGVLQRGKEGGASRRDSTTNTSHVHLPNESTRARELPFDLILNEKHQLELRLAISQGGREVSKGGG